MPARLLRIFVPHVEIDEVLAPAGHFGIDGPGRHVARCERFHRVVFVHELFAVLQTQDRAVTPHRLRDEEIGLFGRMVERGGMELDELHVFGDGLGAVAHGDAVACGDARIGRRRIDVAAAARSDDGEFGQHGFDLVALQVQHVSSEAGQAARVAGDEFAQVVLCQQVDGEMVFENRDVGVLAYRGYQGPFDLSAREVLVVEDTMFGMSAFAVEFEASVGCLVEFRAPGDQVADQFRGPANYQFDGCGVAFAGTADQGVVNMFFESVGCIGHRTDASLGIVGVALVHFPFSYQGNVAVFCGFEGETQSGGAGSDDQKIGFHGFQRLDRPR